jgi:2-keto-4-pentenoate hydratase/2-oxohepta-3-ene-1,7-dioic acid hydratase in catechol pathway
MRIITYWYEERYHPRYGILISSNEIVDLQGLLQAFFVEVHDMTLENAYALASSIFSTGSRNVIQRIMTFKDVIVKALSKLCPGGKCLDTKIVRNINELNFLPPIYDPQKIIGIGLNFEEYRLMLKYSKPEVPLFFFKPISTLIGHREKVVIPRGGKWPGTSSKIVFHEYELAVIIGKRARFVDKSRAFDYIYGFTIFSDITAHDIEMIQPGHVLYQQRAKAFDTFSPMGPWIVTKDELVDRGIDIYNLRMVRRRNNIVEGESNTKNLVFKIEEIIEFLSEIMSLEPGDVISLGSPPAGPSEGLQPGDVIEVEIENIGTLTNYVA